MLDNKIIKFWINSSAAVIKANGEKPNSGNLHQNK